METITNENLESSALLFDELVEQVMRLESDLGGGKKLPVKKGSKALEDLRKTSIKLGNPRDQLMKLAVGSFNPMNLPKTEIALQQLQQDAYDYYWLTLTVNLFGAPGVQFDELICKIDFGPKGDYEPIIQLMYPPTQWNEVIKVGASLKLEVDANLGWRAGIQLPGVMFIPDTGLPPNEIAANIQNTNDYHGQIIVPDFTFSLGRKEISAAGKGDSTCRWIITDPQLKKTDHIDFGIVFKTPKGLEEIRLEALVFARPSLPWLAAHLRHIAPYLSEKLNNFISRKQVMQPHDRELWEHLALPSMPKPL